jgi:vacuolar-type H+-ATPase subunit I/STV1
MGSTGTSLTAAWTSFYSSLTGNPALDALLKLAAIVGVVMVIFGIVKYLNDYRRGNGGVKKHMGLVAMIVVGATFAAPSVIVPLYLILAGLVISSLGGIVHLIASA